MTQLPDKDKPGRNSACPCGSGHKYKHCCGRLAAPSSRPGSGIELGEAMNLLQHGRQSAADAVAKRVLQREPRNAMALYLHGLALAQNPGTADLEQAESEVARAIKLGLSDPAAGFHHAGLLTRLGRPELAIAALQECLARRPGFQQASVMLANLYCEIGQWQRADPLYREAIEVDAGHWSLWFNHATALHRLGREAEAIEALRQVIHLNPGLAEAHAKLATLLERQGSLELAQQHGEHSLSLSPGDPQARLVLARCARRLGQPQRALEVLGPEGPANVAAPAARRAAPLAAWWNEHAKALDALGRYQQAHADFTHCNQLLAQDRVSVGGAGELIQRTAAAARLLSTAADDAVGGSSSECGPKPIFVLGPFRSGTSLVEQILASHPAVAAAGELEALGAIEDDLLQRFGRHAKGMGSPAGRAALKTARSDYLESLRAAADDTGAGLEWVVDKHPLNLLRLPLIARMFPAAAVVTLVRHPLDVVLSITQQHFEDPPWWSLSVDDAAWMVDYVYRQGRLSYPKLQHGRSLLLKYEDLVAEPEVQMRALLAHLRLEWHPDCLSFHQRRATTRTASYAQVSEPLYRHAVARHRNYPQAFTPESLALLEPLVAELGYRPG